MDEVVRYKKDSNGKESVDLGLSLGLNRSTKAWSGRTLGSKARYVAYATLYYSAVVTVWSGKIIWRGVKIISPYVGKCVVWTVGAGWSIAKMAAPYIGKCVVWTARSGWSVAKVAVPYIGKCVVWTAGAGWSVAKKVYKSVRWGAQHSWNGLQQAGQTVFHHAKDLYYSIKQKLTGRYQTLHEEPLATKTQEEEQLTPALVPHRFTQEEVAKALQEAMAVSPNQPKGAAGEIALPCGLQALQGEHLQRNPEGLARV